MDNQLRKALERRGLPADADERDAQDFYAQLPVDEKGKLGVELANPDVRNPDPEPLQLRETLVDEELTTRSVSLRAATIDEESRSVEAVIATEYPVTVWDWRRGEPIDEVLLIDGARLPDQLPLLANHSRWDLDDVLGSGRKINAVDTKIMARLYFAENDEPADRAWNKARQGHLTDVSIGYRVIESTDIQPNSTTKVNGRTFKSGKRALRIATAWEPVEVSLVPIGADQAAKLRQSKPFQLRGKNTMDPKLRAYLETIGLRAEADDTEANQFRDKLTGEQRTRADELAAGQKKDPPAAPPPANTQRSAPPAADPPAAPPDPAEIARQAIAEERERVRQITELAGADVPQAVRERAVTEGWEIARASQEFLVAVRTGRQPTDSPIPGGPAIHSRDHAIDCNVRTLTAGLLAQNGLDPTRCREYDTHTAREGAAFTEQEAERGREFERLSAVDICREAVRIDTGRYIRDPEESIRAALSGGTLSYVFGTNIYAKLVEGWLTIGDSTELWCDNEDVPNFLTQEEITINVDGTPEMHGRGDTATDATIGDKHETYRAYRFTKKATVDELDIINDRLGALMKFPVEMGMAFRRMRPNLVYSTLLNNAALIADSIAVFHASHSNLATAALDATSLSAGLTSMSSQRLPASENKSRELLGIQGRFLVVPAALQFAAAQLLNSVALAKTHADKSDPNYMPVNPVGPAVIKQVIGDTLTLVSDDRVGAVGCWDPMTKAMVTGSATNWFLSAGPYRGVRVLYRRGTNRQPVVRNYALDRGEWGIGWDMNIDIGCKIMDFRGLYKSSGDG